MTTRFTPVQADHVSAHLQIYNHYVLNSTATFHDHCITETEMRQLLFFDKPRYQAFSIWEDGPDGAAIIGYCLVHQFHEREAYNGTGTISVYLKPDKTGKGHGSAALRYMEEFAKEQQFHVLMAIICRENAASIRLFEGNGYTQCAHLKEVGRKFGRLLDIVYYQKVL